MDDIPEPRIERAIGSSSVAAWTVAFFLVLVAVLVAGTQLA
ncbi:MULTISPECIES: hypothetical protein [Lysobacter]|uniref:Uncharacterized protein n=1 Tax=Lysobacter firmicutimachus TaxID=1792846 RepID=A0ABU8D8X0_9GAMM|nr:hypothetical protein [Lysobacter antibioticus]